MNLRLIQLLLLLFLTQGIVAQKTASKKWWVSFTDKNNTPYCTCRPAEFLSARALERRARAGIPVEEEDLPVDPAYVRKLCAQGARLHHTSRWLNAATVIADSATAQSLLRLPFVREVEYLGPDLRILNPPDRPAKERKPLQHPPKLKNSGSIYGYGALQGSMLGVPLLHTAGYRGKGVWIAVLDGGFTNVDTLPHFDSLALQGRLFQGRDFVERDQAVYESAMHGTTVLSVMGANLQDYFVGTAPDATYFLVKTEDTGGEFPVEEANWIAGAEWADSLGADIINASLGYTTFNDTTLSHSYSQLDGRSTLGARGASIAARKGMVIFNSAGNSGDEPWKYLGVPADAPGVVAVGAVQHDGSRAVFSSVGPAADGRIKPDLVAPGDMVVVAGDKGTDLQLSSGTSLAAPLLSGALASLWSAFPEKTAAEIMDAVYKSADQYTQPDNLRGYGLPDMTSAWLHLAGYLSNGTPNNAGPGLFAINRAADQMSFLVFADLSSMPDTLLLKDIWGNRLPCNTYSIERNRLSRLTITGIGDLPPGYYTVEVFLPSGLLSLRVLL